MRPKTAHAARALVCESLVYIEANEKVEAERQKRMSLGLPPLY